MEQIKHQRKKISIIGAGFVGSTCAHWAAIKELGNIVLLDLHTEPTQGKALDLLQSLPVEGLDGQVHGTSDYKDIAHSDLVILTAGLPRKPGMSRDELLLKNARIVQSCCQHIRKEAPQSIVIVVSNPLDAMAYVAKQTLGFPRERVLGMAGVLDSARFRAFLAQELEVSVKDVHAFVLGGHGDTMLPLPRYCSIGGVPLSQWLSKDKMEALIERTRKGGAEIVGLLKTGSAYYAPSASVVQMAEAILKDQKRILPCAVWLEGEYHVKELFLGVLAKLGGRGMEKVLEVELSSEERKSLEHSIQSVQQLTQDIKAKGY